MFFFFWKVTKIFFEYFYQYLPLLKAVTQILNLSVPPGHDISGKKISSLSCFILSGTWVKILMRLGNLFHLWYFFSFLTWLNHRHYGLAHCNGSPALGCSTEGSGCFGLWRSWRHYPWRASPSGASCLLLILLGLAWLRKGFSLKIDSW